MLRRCALRFVLGLFLALVGPVPLLQAADVTATTVSSGVWNNASIWDTADYPDNGNGGLTYDVVANQNLNFLATLDVVVESILFDSIRFEGEGSGAGSITLNQPSTAIGVNFRYVPAFGGAGPLTIQQGASIRGALNNNGHVIWESGVVSRDFEAGLFRNVGVLDLQGDGLSFNNTTNVQNQPGATLSRTVGAGVVEIGGSFSNQGIVDVDTGTLALSGNNGASTGAFDIASGAVLEIRNTGGTGAYFDFDAGSSVTGDGTLRVVAGGINVNAPLTVPNLDFGNSARLDSTNGSLEITNSLSVGTSTVMTGNNTLGAGATATLANNARMDITGTFTNNGTIVWQETASASFLNDGSLHNFGVIEIQGNTGAFGVFDGADGADMLVNEVGGVIHRSSGGGVAGIDVTRNDGTIDIDTGKVFKNGTIHSSGVIDIAAGAEFEASTLVLEQGAQVTGDGFLIGFNINLSGDASVENLRLGQFDNLRGQGNVLTVDNLEWIEGTIHDNTILGPGSVVTTSTDNTKNIQGTVRNQGTLRVTGPSVNVDGELINEGTIEVSGGAFACCGAIDDRFTDGIVTNTAGGQILRTGNGSSGLNLPLNNMGLIDSQAGTLDVQPWLGSSGTFKASSGGVLRVDFEVSDSDLTEGTWIAENGVLEFTDTNVDVVEAGATLRVSGASAEIRRTNNVGGVVKQNKGLLEVINGATHRLANRPGTSVPGFASNQGVSLNTGEILVGENSAIDATSSTDALYTANLLRGAGTVDRVYSGGGGELRGEPVLTIGSLLNVGDTTIAGRVDTTNTEVWLGTLTVPSGATLGASQSNDGVKITPPETVLGEGHIVVDGVIDADVSVQDRDSSLSGVGTITGSLRIESGTVSSTGTLSVEGDFFGGGAAGPSQLTSGTLDVDGLTVIAGQFTLDSGTTLSGPADVEVISSGLLKVDNTLTRNVVATSGTVRGVGTIDGNFAVQNGTINNAADDDLQVTGDLTVNGNSVVGDGNLEVLGAVTVNSGSTLTIAQGASLTGPGAITLSGGAPLVASGASSQASGASLPATLLVNGETDQDVVAQLGEIDGNGVIGGDVMLQDSLLSSQPAGTLRVGGELTVMGSSTIGEAGTTVNVEVDGDTHIPANQSLVISEDAVLGGIGPLVPDADSTLINRGTVNKAPQLPAGTLNIEGDFPGLMVPEITIARVGPFGIFRMPIIRIDGSLQIAVQDGGGNSAPAEIDLGATTLPGSLAIDTTSDVTADDLILDGGNVLANPGGGGLASGRVSGTGSVAIQTDTTSLFPGASPGSLTFSDAGNDALTLSLADTTGQPDADPTFLFEVNDATGTAGANPGWDAVFVSSGGVTIDTTDSAEFVIEVHSLGLDDEQGELANFDPTQSYTWRFLDTANGFFGAPIGSINFVIDDVQFAFENNVALGSLSVIQDTPSSLALLYSFVGEVLYGDYNDDGVVDAADYTVWRDNLDQSVTLPNDITPGFVDTSDYDVWSERFGSSTAGTADTIPEPATVLLISVAALTSGGRRSRGA